jgi:hypothetical protein
MIDALLIIAAIAVIVIYAKHREAKEETNIDSLWATLIKVADYLGIDYDEARKENGKPSEVYIAAIKRARIEAVREFAESIVNGENVPYVQLEDGHYYYCGDYIQQAAEDKEQELK